MPFSGTSSPILPIEAGSVDQNVERHMGPVGYDDAIRHDAGDLPLDDVRIRELHRVVSVLVRFRDAGAPEIVVGRQFALQSGSLMLSR